MKSIYEVYLQILYYKVYAYSRWFFSAIVDIVVGYILICIYHNVMC